MISLCLVAPILMGEKSGGWNAYRKAIACVWCLMIDAIYIVPAVL